MGAEQLHDVEAAYEDDADSGRSLAVIPGSVEVRRRGSVAALLGGAACVVAISYLARAAQTGGALDWFLAVFMGGLGAVWLAALLDARTPLVVADAQGIRIRLANAWQGMPWSAVHHVEVTPRRGLLRHGCLTVVPHNPDFVRTDLGPRARAQARWARLLHGSALAVPLGTSTRVIAEGDDVAEALLRLAPNPDQVVIAEDPVEEPIETPAESAEVAEPEPEVEDDAPPVVASATPAPLRDSVTGRRAEVHRQVEDVVPPAPQGREFERPGVVSLVEETESWGDRVRPIATAGDSVAVPVIDDFALEPAEDPIIGPELAAARTRLGLTVDQVAERTRIRPHVVESIEVDDFEPCGGDFYARGHLRTLARVLGVDATGLITAYDERYARAPINARRVFEAELATGANGTIRATRGGPNWSVLVAVVMALILCWSVARLVMDTPPDLRSTTPVLNGSGGPQGAGAAPAADPVPVVISAETGGARVVVRDGGGEIVFAGNLAVGQSQTLKVAPPVRVQSSDGAVTVAVDGSDARPVGDAGTPGQGTFVGR